MAKSRKDHAIRRSPYPVPSPSTPITRYDTPNSVESTPPQTIHSPHSYVLHPSDFREILQSRDAYPISMDQVMKWLDYTQRSSLIALMKRNFTPGVHYVRTPKSSKESKTYFFTVESFKEMCKLRRNGERKKLAEAWSTAESLYGVHVPNPDKKNPFDKHKIDIEDDEDDEEEEEFAKESKDKHSRESSDSEEDPQSSVSSPVPESPMKRRSMTGLVALDKKEMLYHSNDEDEDSEYTTSSESDDEPFTIKEKPTPPYRVITHNHNTRIIHNVSPSKPQSNSLSNSSNSIQATQQNSNISNNNNTSNNNNNNNNSNAHTSTPNNKPNNPPQNSPSVASVTSNQASTSNQNQSTQQNNNNNNNNTTNTTTTTHAFQWTENNARLEHILKVIDSSVPLMPISSHYSSFTLPNTYTTHTPSTFLTSLTNITSLVEIENSSSTKAYHTNSTVQDFVRDSMSMHNTASFHSHYRTSTQLCDLTPLLVE